MCNDNDSNSQDSNVTLPENLTQTPSPEVFYETFDLKRPKSSSRNIIKEEKP